jgi:hypothetical protein
VSPSFPVLSCESRFLHLTLASVERLSTTTLSTSRSSPTRLLALSFIPSGYLSLILAGIFDNVKHAIPTSRNFSERNQQNMVPFSLSLSMKISWKKPEMRLLLSASSSSTHLVSSHVQPETTLFQLSNVGKPSVFFAFNISRLLRKVPGQQRAQAA